MGNSVNVCLSLAIARSPSFFFFLIPVAFRACQTQGDGVMEVMEECVSFLSFSFRGCVVLIRFIVKQKKSFWLYRIYTKLFFCLV